MLQSTSFKQVFYQICSIRHVCYPSFKNRRTSRTGGNCVLPKQAWRYEVSMGRNFQRDFGRRFGFGMGLSDKLLLVSMAQGCRRLDEKKIKQMNNILKIKIEEITSMHESISQLGIKVNKSFTEAIVYWTAQNRNFEKIQSVLDEEKHSLRKSLSDSFGVNSPQLRFLQDKSDIIMEEMDKLFKKADYGIDYRALNKTARTLGNVQERPDEVPERIRVWQNGVLSVKK